MDKQGKMCILVACEESQAVTIAFRKKGHLAFSCDLLPCSGGHPEWHIQGDVLKIIDGLCMFKTADGKWWDLPCRWDMIIAFPPCTHIASSGARHFEKKREDGRQRQALEFMRAISRADTPRLVIENPRGIAWGKGEYIKEHFPDLYGNGLPLQWTQCIQPYDFGHKACKATYLYLRGVPKLKATCRVDPDIVEYTGKDGRKYRFSRDFVEATGGRGYIRSKTYQGVAAAMADQWG